MARSKSKQKRRRFQFWLKRKRRKERAKPLGSNLNQEITSGTPVQTTAQDNILTPPQ